MPRTPEDLSFVPQLKLAWSVSPVVILENGDGFAPSIIFLTVSRIGSSAGTTAVDISISPTGRMLNNGSALPQTINFAAGETSKVLSLTPVDDLVYTGDTVVTITATDKAGVLTVASATAQILEDEMAPVIDTTKPVIALIGANPQLVANGGVYTDLKATVTDNVDASREITGTGTVNTAVASDYTVTYNASDAAGNAAIAVTRTVRVAAALGFNLDNWLAGQTLDSATLAKLAIGGASSATANDGEQPVVSLAGGQLVLSAIIRTGQPTGLQVAGQAVSSLSDYTVPSSITSVGGVRAGVQGIVPQGCERQEFKVDQGSLPKQFLRLKATLP